MLHQELIRIILFAILCICFVFYLFFGIDIYKKDRKSKVNVDFLILCISCSLWALGYAFMLISPSLEIARIWRIVSALGWFSFNAVWISFASSIVNINKENYRTSKIQFLIYIITIIFFINSLVYQPSKEISNEVYGFVDNLYTTKPIGVVFSIFILILFVSSILIIYFQMRNSHKNRVKIQMKTILITSLISFVLAGISDLILPMFGILNFPLGIITVSIGMGGMWYAINKHKMMSISYELVSEYIFEAVNEPIFILSEDLLIKNCNEASLNITGYDYLDLERKSLNVIINFRDFKFNTIMQEEKVVNIEVDLHKKNKDKLICELSGTVIYDEYKDVLGILVILHDVSERKKIDELQKLYTYELEDSNIKLKKEIEDRLHAEEQIRHFVYYDALTEVPNRKKMLEDINILLENKNDKFAVLFIDLDKFKSANDNYGHLAGDEILKSVGRRLKDIVSSMDTIYRIGGDEFIIILRDLKDTENVKKIAIAAVKTLSTTFTYKENKLLIGSSIGISIFPDHGIDADTLIKNADLGMYEAKRKGGNRYNIYSAEMEENLNK
ncbi:diguanylate cyclase domain-containing protein [Clostridium lacusfryxellense]|uniref:diguanylate cyclase domain-containing protein n=1 Tax=Clostridium lacusfryxellense TaxID=205328 RepID=UPI001C0DCED7|nr:diguanylate cyclase [Clostridium lacusfryxellense]MBU3114087.1 diguanylate cyclase [Clostridium lacusfryxellense]